MMSHIHPKSAFLVSNVAFENHFAAITYTLAHHSNGCRFKDNNLEFHIIWAYPILELVAKYSIRAKTEIFY
jgi:hypothetical protein